jgi:hypothetical protein
MKIFKRILILAMGLFLTGCEDVIDVDLDTAPPRLVIDASIDWVKNTPGNEQKIKLSTTTDFYSPTFPTVSGAIVIITNTAGTIFNFTESTGTGEYICTDFVPVLGETYTLRVTLNGETYTAEETLIGTPDIEDAIEQNNDGGMLGDEIEIVFKYQDNGSQENYYLTSAITNYDSFPHYHPQDDRFSQGNLISEDFSDEDLKAGDVVNLKLYGISKRYYEYFNKLQSSTGGGGPFPTIPTLVRGNIINQTNSANFTLGYFRLSQVDTRDYTIQ